MEAGFHIAGPRSPSPAVSAAARRAGSSPRASALPLAGASSTMAYYPQLFSPHAPSSPRGHGPGPHRPQSAKVARTAVAWSTPLAVAQPGVSPGRPGQRILTFSSPAPAKNLSAMLRKVHSPDCLACGAEAAPGAEEGTEGSTPATSRWLPSPDASGRRQAAAQLCRVPCAAPEAALHETAALKQQLRRARDQQLLSTKMVDRLKREAAGWRDKFAALSESEKRSSLQLHELSVKVAERDDWLRESRPHKQMLQEQTAQMRADYEREIRDLKAQLASAHVEAQAVRERLEDRCECLKAEQLRAETALREGLRELDAQCASLRAQLDEASPLAAKVPHLEQELELERARTAQLHTCEEQIAQMTPELEDLRSRLPDLKAAAAKAIADMEQTRHDNRKIEEAHQNLIKSLELTHVQHEQLQATSRQERKADEARFARERAALKDQLADVRAELEAAHASTARVQKLLEEERQRGERAAQASARELEEVRADAAAAQRKAEVARATAAKKHEAALAQLDAKLKEEEKAHRATQNTLEEVRGELDEERLALARETQQRKQCKQERDSLSVEVERLQEEVRACNEGIKRSQTDTEAFIEAISQYLDKMTKEFERLQVLCSPECLYASTYCSKCTRALP